MNISRVKGNNEVHIIPLVLIEKFRYYISSTPKN